LNVNDRDFLSTDEKELMQPRAPNGDLPAIKFLHLSPHSQLLDRGVDAGFPFHGTRPDLGAFEE
jgi:hypothetical protein